MLVVGKKWLSKMHLLAFDNLGQKLRLVLLVGKLRVNLCTCVAYVEMTDDDHNNRGFIKNFKKFLYLLFVVSLLYE